MLATVVSQGGATSNGEHDLVFRESTTNVTTMMMRGHVTTYSRISSLEFKLVPQSACSYCRPSRGACDYEPEPWLLLRLLYHHGGSRVRVGGRVVLDALSKGTWKRLWLEAVEALVVQATVGVGGCGGCESAGQWAHFRRLGRGL